MRTLTMAILLAGAVLLATTCWNAARVQAQTEAADTLPEVASHDFTGKILLLEVDRSTTLERKSSSVVMFDARIVRLGDRYFAQGKGHAPDGIEHWSKGATMGIAWESVIRFYAMTPEKFETYAARWKDKWKDD